MSDSIMLISKKEVIYLTYIAFDIELPENVDDLMSEELLRRCTQKDSRAINDRIITQYGERVLKANFKRLIL